MAAQVPMATPASQDRPPPWSPPPLPRDPAYYGALVIGWPHPGPKGAMAPWSLTLHDARTGEPVTTVTAMTVHWSPDRRIEITARMFADADGNPIFDGPPVLDGKGGVVQGEFVFRAEEMHVQEPR